MFILYFCFEKATTTIFVCVMTLLYLLLYEKKVFTTFVFVNVALQDKLMLYLLW